ncbi:MAG: CAP domain-containing protein [Planctomycetes bacterium]|jgi:pathogenesis-related protein 1|nr:CAP domain-containing protein [Planctomycetota bacterium]
MNFKVLAITPAILLACQAGHAADFDPADFVIAHNRWRAYAGITEKLSYSAALAMTAQSWADNLKRTQHCQLRHSKPDGRYGENLYWAGAVQWSNGHRELQKVTPAQVVDSWGSERAYYDRKRNSCAPGKVCGHYTQLVWRSTERVGCAMAICEDTKEQVWVCQYQPAGNWVGQRPY